MCAGCLFLSEKGVQTNQRSGVSTTDTRRTAAPPRQLALYCWSLQSNPAGAIGPFLWDLSCLPRVHPLVQVASACLTAVPPLAFSVCILTAHATAADTTTAAGGTSRALPATAPRSSSLRGPGVFPCSFLPPCNLAQWLVALRHAGVLLAAAAGRADRTPTPRAAATDGQARTTTGRGGKEQKSARPTCGLPPVDGTGDNF
jgi:hypothetical protein